MSPGELLGISQHQSPPPSAGGGQPSVPNSEKEGSEKNECLGSLKESLPQIFAWRITMFLIKKGLCKIKYSFEG